jgi:hypothetical protein
VPDRQCKEIDYLVGVGTDDMRTQNLTRSLFDQGFIAIHPLRKTACGEPIGVFSDFTLNFNPCVCAWLSFKPTVAIGGTVKATLGTPR